MSWRKLDKLDELLKRKQISDQEKIESAIKAEKENFERFARNERYIKWDVIPALEEVKRKIEDRDIACEISLLERNVVIFLFNPTGEINPKTAINNYVKFDFGSQDRVLVSVHIMDKDGSGFSGKGSSLKIGENLVEEIPDKVISAIIEKISKSFS